MGPVAEVGLMYSEPMPVPITGVTGPADGGMGTVALGQDDDEEKAQGQAADGSGIGAAKMSCGLMANHARPSDIRATPIAAITGVLLLLAFRRRYRRKWSGMK